MRWLPLLALTSIACSKVPPVPSDAASGTAPAEKQGSTSSAVPAIMSAIPAAVPSAMPLTTAERGSILAGVAELKALVRERTASIPNDTEATCDARQKRFEVRIRPANAKVGESRLRQATRFANAAPDLGQDVESVISACTMGCLLEDGTVDPGNKEGREMVRRSCRQASTALDDLVAQLGP